MEALLQQQFDPQDPRVPAAAFATGTLLHLGFFRRGEWDIYSNQIVIAFSMAYASLVAGFVYYLPPGPEEPWEGVFSASKLFLAFIGGIYSSMLAYRAFWHPLGQFPGPFAARLSSFYGVSVSMKKFHLFKEVQALHQSYGDIMRIGPNELSIASPSAVLALHSNTSPCLKGPWYNVFQPMISLHATRDKQEHAYRRKLWDKGFNAKALRDYEPRIAKYTRQLMGQMEERAGKPVDISLWLDFFGFDVMGDLAFGNSFNMLKEGVKHYYMELTQKSTLWGTQFGRTPWAYLLIKNIPILNTQIKQFMKWLEKHVKQRIENEPDLPDVFSWVLAPFKELPSPTKQHELNLIGDAHLIVVAGSDTTSATMTSILFQLAQHPEVYKELQKEVDEYFTKNEEPDNTKLSKLTYFQAVVDEAIRLYPAIPSGVQRITPDKGLQIDGFFIPGNTIVQVPSYTVNRDARCFVRPNEFIPERWTSKPELVKDASVFAPFSIGKYSCVGKQLGLMEVRYVISQIVHKYNIRFAPDQTPEAFVDGLADGFTLACPELNLVLEPRQAE